MKVRLVIVFLLLNLMLGCATEPAQSISDSCENLEFVHFMQLCRSIATNHTDKLEIVDSPLTTREYKKNYKVIYATEKYLSFWAEEYSYLGGAHGTTMITVGTINRQTCKLVEISDLLKETEYPALKVLLRQGAIAQLGGEDHLQNEVEITNNFYFDKDGVHFIYNQYVIACYADGIVEVVVPYSVFML